MADPALYNSNISQCVSLVRMANKFYRWKLVKYTTPKSLFVAFVIAVSYIDSEKFSAIYIERVVVLGSSEFLSRVHHFE